MFKSLVISPGQTNSHVDLVSVSKDNIFLKTNGSIPFAKDSDGNVFQAKQISNGLYRIALKQPLNSILRLTEKFVKP